MKKFLRHPLIIAIIVVLLGGIGFLVRHYFFNSVTVLPSILAITDSPCSNNTIGQSGGTNTVYCDPPITPFIIRANSTPPKTNQLIQEGYRTDFKITIGSPPLNGDEDVSYIKIIKQPVDTLFSSPIIFDHSAISNGVPAITYTTYFITKTPRSNNDFAFALK